MARNIFRGIFSLLGNTDVDKTVQNISDGVTLRGYNVWILVCSIILASIGLDVNSVAVIIGAMLISPLMSPILGVGLSLGMHDRELFVHSLKNLAIATIISLVASTLYFLVTPFGNITSELLARTSPTLLDVMVAFFGGVAGIVSMSRSESTNAIPGVAIATALMPPICTAGYGLASGHWDFFLGAFYLYIINALFISLATYLIVKYLKFPIKQYINKKLQRRYTQLSWVVLILACLPSIYFLANVYRDIKTKSTIQELVIAQLENEGNEILKWELEARDSVTNINVYYSGVELPEAKLRAMEETCRNNGLKKCHLKALRVNITKEEVKGMSTDVARQLLNEWQIKMMEKEREDSALSNMWKSDALQVSREIQAAFTFVDSVSIGKTIQVFDSLRTDTFTNIWYASARHLGKDEELKMRNYLRVRMHVDSIILRKL